MNATDEQTMTQLKELAAAAGPATHARPDLARQVLDRIADRRLGPAPMLSVLGGLVAIGAIAAAALSDGGDYRQWTQPSGAMRPTVAVGQTVVLGAELTPQRGDVVLVKATSGDKTWESLGRVIGLPDDTVSCPPQQDGTCQAVVVSGRPLREPWLKVPTEPFPPTAIGPEELFLLGDARDQANDSRFIGPQPFDAVLGVVIARIAPDGSRERLPGAPRRELPDGTFPDPADPVPPASD